MLNVIPALDHFGFHNTSRMIAVQQVSENFSLYNDPEAACAAMLHKLFGFDLYRKYEVVGNADDYYLTLAQAAVEEAIKMGGKVEDGEELLARAQVRAAKFMTDPSHQYFFAHEPTVRPANATVQTAVATSVETKVEIKADGSIKKGGKGVLAEALFKKLCVEGDMLPGQAFIKVLMDEAQMTKGGATTYNYNMKKLFEKELAAKAAKAA